jgi:O-antigen/teichoic acid export membrane protein
MSETKGSYRQIFKATSIFGGVQVFNILVTIIRSKFIAILLNPAGMGIVGLLTSTTGLITGLTNFGLGTSAVKNVAAANASGDVEKLGKTVATFRRLVWITGLLGLLVTLITAQWLSKITFGNDDYTMAFIFISVTLLFTQLSAGQMVILRGMRKIQYMAKASLFGALIGLVTSIPLYYFYGEKGIVPAIIVTSLTALLLTWHFSNRISIPKFKPDKEMIFTEGKEMLKMGFLISLSNLITLGTSFLVRIFINKHGNVGDVGLYVAGFSLIGNYVGIVLTSMSTDYYPRLSAVFSDNKKCKQEINQQAEIAILLLAPIIIIFFVFSKWAIIILYSHKFIPIATMVLWAALGIFFKAASWSIAFIFLAKSEGKIYFWNELAGNIYLLCLNCVGYYYMGLTGLGISFLIAYFLYFIQVLFVSRKLFQFSFGREFIRIFMIQIFLAIISFSVQFSSKITSYSVGIVMIIFSLSYSYKILNKKLNISQILMKRINIKL